VTDDEHIAELQRQAYGAHTPDAARARAVAELAELAATGRDGGPPPAPTRDAAAAEGAVPGAPPDQRASDRTDRDGVRVRVRRWAVIAGVAGLLVGGVLGTAIGRVTPAGPELTPADIAPTGPAFGSGEPGTPIGDTGLTLLFDRLPPVADAGPVERAAEGIDPASVRLVAIRSDGPAAYVARTSDGDDVCLVVLLPDGPSDSRCTVSGRMPAGGLRIHYPALTHGFVLAILNSAGTVTLGLDAGR
jgi:hypothetical protein